jgi:hypothetical protein
MYRTIITVTVLSENNIVAGMSLEDIVREGDEGDFVLSTESSESEELTGKQMADALYAAASDPGFFMLNNDGTRREA